MKLLLTGPAGSGKTHRILDEFVSALKASSNPLEDDYFLILPSAEHVDRMTMLALQKGLKGFFKRRITTLSDFIRSRFSVGDVRLASSSSRFMILRDILASTAFPPFESVQNQPGFSEVLLQFFSELKESLIRPDSFRTQMNQMKRTEPDLAVKYESLAALYETYEDSLLKEGLVERQDLYWILKKEREEKGEGRRKKEEGRFKHLWMDGFFDFTPLQLAYLEMLSETKGSITITLTKDKAQERDSVFYAPIQTEKILTQMGFEIENLPRANHRFSDPSLGALEENLFQHRKKKVVSSPKSFVGDPLSVTNLDSRLTHSGMTDKDKKSIRIFESVGIQGEIEMIAREILKFVQGQQIRFSECALLLRHIGNYEAVIRSVFDRYQIPVEIHEREQSSFSPWMHTIILFLKITNEGWSRDDLFDFLKSSYIRKIAGKLKDSHRIYGLEHEAIRKGIAKGREKWLETQTEIFQSIAHLEDKIRNAKTITQKINALKQGLLIDFGMGEDPETILARDQAGRARFESLLDEIRTHALVRGKSDLSFEDFSSQFFKLAELDLYSVHTPDKNRVQVYDISHARQKEYRVVFVAGLLEKVFPLQIKEDPVLSDWERELFNSGKAPKLGLKLPRQSIERYFFYLAVTRACDQVILTYPRLDREGKESLPSFYVDEVRSLFPDIVPMKQDLSRPYLKLQDVATRRELEHAVMGGLWHAPKSEEPLLLALTNRLLENSEERSMFERSFYEVKPELHHPEIANYFRTHRLSPTRLEEYAKCHFRYFASKVLKLQNPEDNMNPRHAGTIRHKVMEEFFEHRSKYPKENFSPARIREFVKESFQKSLAQNPLVYEKRYQHLLEEKNIQEELFRVILKELDRLKNASLQPGYFELEFGPKSKQKIPSLKLKDGENEIEISGIIDRVDFDPQRAYALVVDYKPSALFSKTDLDFGISLQLPIYAKVVEEVLKMKPVGAELYAIKKLKSTGFYHAEHATSRISFSSRSKYSEAEFKALIESSMEFIRYFVDSMRKMNIEVQPRKCEDYCEFSAVCRVQKWRREIMKEELKEKDLERTKSSNSISNSNCG